MTAQYLKITAPLPIAEHRRIKAHAATLGMSMKDFLIECIYEKMPHIPNAETIAVLENTDKYLAAKSRGEVYKPENPDDEIIECENYEDFLKKTGIRDWK